jgi:hypothetical protein
MAAFFGDGGIGENMCFLLGWTTSQIPEQAGDHLSICYCYSKFIGENR